MDLLIFCGGVLLGYLVAVAFDGSHAMPSRPHDDDIDDWVRVPRGPRV